MNTDEQTIATVSDGTIDTTLQRQQHEAVRKAKAERLERLRQSRTGKSRSMELAAAILEEEQQEDAKEADGTELALRSAKGKAAEHDEQEYRATMDAIGEAGGLFGLIAKVGRLELKLQQTESKLEKACMEIKTMKQGLHAVTAPSYL